MTHQTSPVGIRALPIIKSGTPRRSSCLVTRILAQMDAQNSLVSIDKHVMDKQEKPEDPPEGDPWLWGGYAPPSPLGALDPPEGDLRGGSAPP
jgi:hypothetical protein